MSLNIKLFIFSLYKTITTFFSDPHGGHRAYGQRCRLGEQSGEQRSRWWNRQALARRKHRDDRWQRRPRSCRRRRQQYHRQWCHNITWRRLRSTQAQRCQALRGLRATHRAASHNRQVINYCPLFRALGGGHGSPTMVLYARCNECALSHSGRRFS